MIPRRPIFSINEAAEILGCSRYYIRQFVDQGILRPLLGNGLVSNTKFSRAELMRVQAELLGDLSQHPQSETEDNPSVVRAFGAYLNEDLEPS